MPRTDLAAIQYEAHRPPPNSKPDRETCIVSLQMFLNDGMT
jgi:hypothetical protein